VRLPHAGALAHLASLTGRDERTWQLPVVTLDSGEPACVEGAVGPVAVASIDGNIVRLAFDPNLLARNGERALLAHLWDHAIAPALEKAARHARETAETAQLEAFARLEERWHRETLARLPSAVESNEYALSRLESQMRELVQKTDDMRRQQRALHLVGYDSLREAARQQWLALRRLVPATYRSIELRGTGLVAHSHEITIEGDDTSVEVGAFEIAIDVAVGTLSITNRTNPRDGAQHPHVRSPSEPCWGNLQPGVVRLLAEREWAGLLTVTDRFLHAYNDRDAFVKLEIWDPDHHDSDDEDYDDDESDDDTVECTICLERVDSGDITHVRDEPVCLGCYERDTFVCAGCSARFPSRAQARESLRCTGCARAPAAQTACDEVAS
jgi:hypothetical protein